MFTVPFLVSAFCEGELRTKFCRGEEYIHSKWPLGIFVNKNTLKWKFQKNFWVKKVVQKVLLNRREKASKFFLQLKKVFARAGLMKIFGEGETFTCKFNPKTRVGNTVSNSTKIFSYYMCNMISFLYENFALPSLFLTYCF